MTHTTETSGSVAAYSPSFLENRFLVSRSRSLLNEGAALMALCLALSGCTAQQRSEYTSYTIARLVEERDAGKCPVGEKVSLPGVDLKQLHGSTYQARQHGTPPDSDYIRVEITPAENQPLANANVVGPVTGSAGACEVDALNPPPTASPSK